MFRGPMVNWPFSLSESLVFNLQVMAKDQLEGAVIALNFRFYKDIW